MNGRRWSRHTNDSLAIGDVAGMHRKSLEAAHQLTSGDESNKEDDDENGGVGAGGGGGGSGGGPAEGNGRDGGGHSSGDEQDKREAIGSNKGNNKLSPSTNAASGHHLSHLHHPPTSEASTYMASYAAAQLHHATRSPVDDFRMNSVAELRAKAAEHQARIAGGFTVSHHHQQQLQQHLQQQQQQQQQTQRDGEFLISSDSSSSSFWIDQVKSFVSRIPLFLPCRRVNSVFPSAPFDTAPIKCNIFKQSHTQIYGKQIVNESNVDFLTT